MRSLGYDRPTRMSPVRTLINRYRQTAQEAQQSQRDRAMLRVIEYFVKSFKIIGNDTLKQDVCRSLLAQ